MSLSQVQHPLKRDEARLEPASERPRFWRLFFLDLTTRDLPLAKLVSADSSWVRFRLSADARGLIFNSAQIASIEEISLETNP